MLRLRLRLRKACVEALSTALRSCEMLSREMKKYSIVEFEDGMHVIPTCWMNKEKSKSIWPRHVKSLYTLQKYIKTGFQPQKNEAWEEWKIVRRFGSTGMY